MRGLTERLTCDVCGGQKPPNAYPHKYQTASERICRRCHSERLAAEAGGKTCTRCKVFHPFANLAVNKYKGSGHLSLCRPCCRVRWREANDRRSSSKPRSRPDPTGETAEDYAKRTQITPEEEAIAQKALARWRKRNPAPDEVAEAEVKRRGLPAMREYYILSLADLMYKEQTWGAV